jgi:hypothetical protein
LHQLTVIYLSLRRCERYKGSTSSFRHFLCSRVSLEADKYSIFYRSKKGNSNMVISLGTCKIIDRTNANGLSNIYFKCYITLFIVSRGQQGTIFFLIQEGYLGKMIIFKKNYQLLSKYYFNANGLSNIYFKCYITLVFASSIFNFHFKCLS